jgi:hypothetical protein
MRRSISIASILPVLLAGACSGDDGPTTEEAVLELCHSYCAWLGRCYDGNPGDSGGCAEACRDDMCRLTDCAADVDMDVLSQCLTDTDLLGCEEAQVQVLPNTCAELRLPVDVFQPWWTVEEAVHRYCQGRFSEAYLCGCTEDYSQEMIDACTEDLCDGRDCDALLTPGQADQMRACVDVFSLVDCTDSWHPPACDFLVTAGEPVCEVSL